MQIEEGVRPSGKSYVTVTDRRTATEYAIGLLREGDILPSQAREGKVIRRSWV